MRGIWVLWEKNTLPALWSIETIQEMIEGASAQLDYCLMMELIWVWDRDLGDNWVLTRGGAVIFTAYGPRMEDFKWRLNTEKNIILGRRIFTPEAQKRTTASPTTIEIIPPRTLPQAITITTRNRTSVTSPPDQATSTNRLGSSSRRLRSTMSPPRPETKTTSPNLWPRRTPEASTRVWRVKSMTGTTTWRKSWKVIKMVKKLIWKIHWLLKIQWKIHQFKKLNTASWPVLPRKWTLWISAKSKTRSRPSASRARRGAE